MATEEKKERKQKAAKVEETQTPSKRKAELDELEVDVNAPEPPSKRAKRALKKGKSLPTKPSSDSDDDDLDPEDKPDAKAPKTRSEHSVWIGNLRFTVTALELRQWLIDNSGESITKESITRIKLPTVKDPAAKAKGEPPANKGFAYVDFSELGPKVAAIALSETEWYRRKLLIKDATSFEGRPAKEKEPDESAEGVKDGPEPSRKIFVGNMGFKTTEDDLRHNFEKCGEIEWAKLATFEDTGKCKGYGWVKFKEAAAAAWAVKGFVKIKEAVETEEDFQEDAEEDADRQRKYTTRKWWVNRIQGRELKLELAEDDQTRYKKRYGKGAKRPGEEDGKPRAPREGPARQERERPVVDLQTARMTATAVEGTGTKVTFD